MHLGRTLTAGVLVAIVAACTPAAPTPSPTSTSSATPAVRTTPSPTPTPTPTLRPTPTPEPITISVVGDSLTSGQDVEIHDTIAFPDESWLKHLGAGVSVQEVWAVPGTTTDDMRWSVQGPTSAHTLVLMAGENDADNGRLWEDIAVDIGVIVDVMQPPEILLVGPTPTDYDPATSRWLNDALAALARERGWGYVDAGTDVRNDADGTWLAGMSDDGTHPNAHSAPIIAATIEAVLRR